MIGDLVTILTNAEWIKEHTKSVEIIRECDSIIERCKAIADERNILEGRAKRWQEKIRNIHR